MKEINWLELLVCILLASFGGIVKRLSDMERDPEKEYTAGHYISAAIMSTFVGIVVYLICRYFKIPESLTAGLTAMAGFLGTPVIYFLSEISVKRIKTMVKKWIEEE